MSTMFTFYSPNETGHRTRQKVKEAFTDVTAELFVTHSLLMFQESNEVKAVAFARNGTIDTLFGQSQEALLLSERIIRYLPVA